MAMTYGSFGSDNQGLHSARKSSPSQNAMSTLVSQCHQLSKYIPSPAPVRVQVVSARLSGRGSTALKETKLGMAGLVLTKALNPETMRVGDRAEGTTKPRTRGTLIRGNSGVEMKRMMVDAKVWAGYT